MVSVVVQYFKKVNLNFFLLSNMNWSAFGRKKIIQYYKQVLYHRYNMERDCKLSNQDMWF